MTASSLVKIWAALVGLLLMSVVIGLLPYPRLGVLLIFVIATIKAAMVGAYYMGVKREPTYIFYILMTGVICMIILYFALVPDIIWVFGR